MINNFKPTTASRRHMIGVQHKSLTKDVEAPRSLIKSKRYDAARNNAGRVTVRGRGGRVKRQVRVIDYKRDYTNKPGKVMAIHYDPNRTSYIALISYESGKKDYIIAPHGLAVGDTVISGESVPVRTGNAMQLKNIPAGTFVHNILFSGDSDSGLVRAAGTSAVVMGLSGEFAQLKMPSGEIRLINANNFASIGQVSNVENGNRRFGKAGVKRRMGFRPIVRGVAASPRYHPHGGGQGKNGRHGTGGPAVDKWGNKRFAKTRNNKRTQRLILVSRKGVSSKLSKQIMN